MQCRWGCTHLRITLVKTAYSHYSELSRPTTLAALLALKRAHPDLRIVGGNTEVGIEVKFKAARYRHLAAPTHILELTRMEARACRVAAWQ